MTDHHQFTPLFSDNTLIDAITVVSDEEAMHVGMHCWIAMLLSHGKGQSEEGN